MCAVHVRLKHGLLKKSEKILKIKSLLKEGVDVTQNLSSVDVTTDIEEFMLSVESNITNLKYTMRLTDVVVSYALPRIA